VGLLARGAYAPGKYDRLRLQLKYGPDERTDSSGLVFFATHQAECTAAALDGSLCPRLDLWRDPKATMASAKKIRINEIQIRLNSVSCV